MESSPNTYIKTQKYLTQMLWIKLVWKIWILEIFIKPSKWAQGMQTSFENIHEIFNYSGLFGMMNAMRVAIYLTRHSSLLLHKRKTPGYILWKNFIRLNCTEMQIRFVCPLTYGFFLLFLFWNLSNFDIQ